MARNDKRKADWFNSYLDRKKHNKILEQNGIIKLEPRITRFNQFMHALTKDKSYLEPNGHSNRWVDGTLFNLAEYIRKCPSKNYGQARFVVGDLYNFIRKHPEVKNKPLILSNDIISDKLFKEPYNGFVEETLYEIQHKGLLKQLAALDPTYQNYMDDMNKAEEEIKEKEIKEYDDPAIIDENKELKRKYLSGGLANIKLLNKTIVLDKLASKKSKRDEIEAIKEDIINKIDERERVGDCFYISENIEDKIMSVLNNGKASLTETLHSIEKEKSKDIENSNFYDNLIKDLKRFRNVNNKYH